MRKLLIGFIIGALVCGSTTYAYQMLNVSQVNYTVMANGKPVTSEKLNYNGRTYIEMRETADILGASVVWDEGTKTASVTAKDYLQDKPITNLLLLSLNGEYKDETTTDKHYYCIKNGKLMISGSVAELIPNISINTNGNDLAFSYQGRRFLVPKVDSDIYFYDENTHYWFIQVDVINKKTDGLIYFNLLNERVLSICTVR